MKPTKPLVEAGAREERAATLSAIEVRKAEGEGSDPNHIRFEGLAAPFDEWTTINTPFGVFEERIMRGAYRKVLPDADVRFLGLNHDVSQVMARTTSGTLQLKEIVKGLSVGADLDLRDPDVQRLSVKLERRDITQMSFGFNVDPGEGGEDVWEYDETRDMARRTITQFSHLFDVSPVTFPAYQSTTASLRACGVELVSARGEIDEERLWDLALRIFSGEKHATDSERAALDGVFARTDVVSPWTVERAARAYGQEPRLRAAVQAKGITIEAPGLVPVQEPPVGVGMSAAAARNWLELLAA